MDFGKLITESFNIAWNKKILWIFGALAGGVSGFGGIFNLISYVPSSLPFESPKDKALSTLNVLGANTASQDNQVWYKTASDVLFSPDLQVIILIILAALVVILLFGLLAAFINNLANSALVYSIINLPEREPKLNEGLKAGLHFWFRYLKLNLIVISSYLTLIILLIVVPLIFFLLSLKIIGIIFAIISFLLFLLSIFILGIPVSIILLIAQRIIIAKNSQVIDSLKEAVLLFKNNLGNSILAWLIIWALSFVYGFLTLFLTFIIGAPLVGIVIASFNTSVAAGITVIAVSAVIFMTIFILIGSVWSVFQSSFWTIFYTYLERR
ncbi:MAG: hypothetical protein A2134_02680 [Candidatus Woykebacteria bacterium RBG_16_39_9b]|uniref:Glycerophosphoryl diester phosphodiesterase membrane domain-containing protein n=1 Tax=Candidatus Woykebacteria bacterium RBG_16_39_9b TaxID=1802595 RepID=A0A1G1WDF4_9BACT|nr:MAG: hypothetical protein A2134_02680 [Candidatus Woykebacteria bacterium RBG_16_39_9b]